MSHLPLFSQGVFEFKCILPLFYHSIWSGHIQVTAAAARQDAGNFSVPKSAETPGQGALRTKNVIGILSYVPQLSRIKWRLLPWSHWDLFLKGLPFWGTKGLYHFYPVAVSWGVSASHAQAIFIVVSAALYVSLFKVNQLVNQAFVPSLLHVSCLPGPRYRRQTQ